MYRKIMYLQTIIDIKQAKLYVIPISIGLSIGHLSLHDKFAFEANWSKLYSTVRMSSYGLCNTTYHLPPFGCSTICSSLHLAQSPVSTFL